MADTTTFDKPGIDALNVIPIGHDEDSQDEKTNDLAAEEQLVASFPRDHKKKLLWKVDLAIMPTLVSLYIFSFIDRANIGNAQIEGMTTDLNMTGNQYNIVLSIFFVTYIIFEVPSNYVLEKYFVHRPSLWIGIITVLWGVMMTMHGIVKNYASLTAVRLLMGAFEAGLFPGAILYMNKWYTRFELASRFSVFYIGSALAGAFSGLLAYVFTLMNGVGGLQGWRWIFIMEGIITVALGIAVPFILPDAPGRKTRWLNSEEQAYLTTRISVQDGGSGVHAAGSKFSWATLRSVVTDWQIYLMALVYWSNTVPTYGLKFTMPQIIKNMGFTANKAQLLTIPPYFAGAISAFAFGRLSDKFKRRSYFIAIPQMILVLGYAILTPLAPSIQNHIGPCFFALILANIGCYPINPGASSWISNNLAGPAKRSIAIAYATSLTNIGGIFASYIFIASESPAYPTGFGTSMAFAALGIVAVICLDLNYMRINKQRVAIMEEGVSYTVEELAAMGDRAPNFKYTL